MPVLKVQHHFPGRASRSLLRLVLPSATILRNGAPYSEQQPYDI
jgi:hypothetical protein